MPIHMHNTVCKNVVMHLYISIFENDKKKTENFVMPEIYIFEYRKIKKMENNINIKLELMVFVKIVRYFILHLPALYLLFLFGDKRTKHR